MKTLILIATAIASYHLGAWQRTEIPMHAQPGIKIATVPYVDKALQIEAIRQFPELGIAGSRLNRAFLATVRIHAAAHSSVFQKANWPSILAADAQRSINL